MDDSENNTTAGPVGPGVGDEALESEMPHLTREQWAQRRSERHKPRGREALSAWFGERPVWQRWSIAVPVVAVALVFALTLLEVATSAGRIHPRVRVAGVSVGGLAPDAAAERLSTELADRFEQPVTLVFEDQSWSVEPTAVAAALDTTRAVTAAMEVGRGEGVFDALSERLSAWFRPADLDAPVVGDEALVAGVIQEIATAVDRAPVDASVAIEGTDATVTPSALGLAVRRDEVSSALLRTFAYEERELEIAADFVPVAITDENAEQAAEDARTMMSGPVVVTHDDERWEFAPAQIAQWIAFRTVPAESTSTSAPEEDLAAAPEVLAAEQGSFESTIGAVPGGEQLKLEAYISSDAASATLVPKVGSAGRPAQDAKFSVSNGSVTIVPSQDGVGPDLEALALEMTTTLLRGDERVVALRTMRVEPEITTEKAQAMGIRGRISTYTTHYDSGNKPRVNNIHTLATALDGTLLAPGETFSFNGTIGPRTAAKGYQEAPAIVNGTLVPQLGGGICQVGTTIFNAVFESGLPVVERKNHSFYISHYPKGRDATVSWGGPDFKFKNDTDNYVLIATGFSNSSLTISLYGTDPGYEVTSSTGQWYDVTAHPVKEVQDPLMPAGSRVVEDSGVDGRKIVVTRTVKKAGTVVREDKFTSVYRPKQEVVRVGTKEVSVPTTATAR